MRKIGQIRFYGAAEDGTANSNNSPNSLRTGQLISGSVFSNIGRIVQLGIQTVPGVKFYLNKGTMPIIVGNTGIYDLQLDSVAAITSLSFDATSIALINSNPNSYLIVDYIYEEDV